MAATCWWEGPDLKECAGMDADLGAMLAIPFFPEGIGEGKGDL